MQEKYAHSLEWCLQHRALPLIAAVVLLVFSGWQVLNMGVGFCPASPATRRRFTLSTADGTDQGGILCHCGSGGRGGPECRKRGRGGHHHRHQHGRSGYQPAGAMPTAITDILNSANAYGRYQDQRYDEREPFLP
ncbi:MAG: hypothetical protein ACLVJH_19125 [Faecalibacterium prausnitzii]